MPIVDPRTGEPLSSPQVSPQEASTQPAADAAPLRAEDVIIELDASNIQQVLEASMQVPVLLDCWAPWCEPCKTLMPILEKLAIEYNGAFLLAKLDVEANPEISSQLGVRSVPDVKLVSQGGLVDSFQGALPEKQIREWLARYFPAPEDVPPSPEDQAAEALAAGDAATAREIYQQLVVQYPEHYAYQVALARALVAGGLTEDARSLLDNLPPEEREAPAARGVRASIAFGEQALSHAEIDAMQGRDDSEAQFQRALRQVADGDYEAGLESLLTLMKQDRGYNDDAARKMLLQVFDALGADHPLTVTYRRKLFTMMY
ncbi:tetratricopeptide repeat protein [Halomonas sp. ZH2S]|uniref:Tetratricopeptide repeat protein n=1 Tax=Vreelandella zhuhanensis TaxID=2684210 RepID=A0A7X3GZ42_9GAMM|nr:tetratricopeptide repeat protein [Halomonas zhuhanensis]MWJ27426.1 tetratricopeptide repeat protein [Halomonas zhuhanensis]